MVVLFIIWVWIINIVFIVFLYKEKQLWGSVVWLYESGALFSLQDIRLMLVHRYYSHDYWAMFAHSFSEGSSVQNENGWYLAIAL